MENFRVELGCKDASVLRDETLDIAAGAFA